MDSAFSWCSARDLSVASCFFLTFALAAFRLDRATRCLSYVIVCLGQHNMRVCVGTFVLGLGLGFRVRVRARVRVRVRVCWYLSVLGGSVPPQAELQARVVGPFGPTTRR